MRRTMLSVLALLLLASPSAGQRRCVKGIPCGGTCISATKTCHVGSGSATAAPKPTRTAPTAAPDGARFVASSKGQVYYLATCTAARRLSPANRIYFKSDKEALAAGYRPSASSGCSSGEAVDSASGTPTSTAGPGVSIAPSRGGSCTVTHIYDGDTVTCQTGERVRLLLIDAPEMDQGPFGTTARDALRAIMPLGTTVRVETDVEKQDRYGRTLGYLWLADGRMVNEEMARTGYTLSLTYPPNVQYVDRIRAAVEDAKSARRGLWSGSAFECTPKDHRAKRC